MVYCLSFLIYLKTKYLFAFVEVYMFHFRNIETKFLKRLFYYIFMNIDVIFIYVLLKSFWNNEAGGPLTAALYFLSFWINIMFFVAQPVYYLKNCHEQTFRLFLSLKSMFFIVLAYLLLFLNSSMSAEQEKFTRSLTSVPLPGRLHSLGLIRNEQVQNHEVSLQLLRAQQGERYADQTSSCCAQTN